MRLKITVLLFLVLVGYLLSQVLMLRLVVYPMFSKLEHEDAIRNASRAESALAREQQLLDRVLNDWSSWDSSYAFIAGEDAEYEQNNLTETALEVIDVDLVAFVTGEGKVYWQRYKDADGSIRPFGWLVGEQLGEDHPLITAIREGKALTGLLVEADYVLMVNARPILTSHARGPSRGVLLMGRRLDDAAMRQISQQTRVETRAWVVTNTTLPDQKEIMAGLSNAPYWVRAADHQTLHVFSMKTDLMKRPAILLRSEVPRDLILGVERMFKITLGLCLVAGLGLLVASFLTMTRVFVTPLTQLTQLVVDSRERDVSNLGGLGARRDEIGTLAQAFAKLMRELSNDRHTLVNRSYESGKADVTGSFLHNLKNGLHPIAAYTDLLLTDIRSLPLKEIEAALIELDQPSIDPERRLQLEVFCKDSLMALTALMKEADTTLNKMLNQTRVVIQATSIHHHEPVQQPQERVHLKDLLDAAINQLNQMKVTVKLTGTDALKTAAPLMTQRIPLQHVLVNLMMFQLSDAEDPPVKEVEVRQVPDLGCSGGMLVLEIHHPRLTIPGKELERLFERGYTGARTIPGQGMHWCANTVNGLGGRLQVNAANGGVVFHLQLPYTGTFMGDTE